MLTVAAIAVAQYEGCVFVYVDSSTGSGAGVLKSDLIPVQTQGNFYFRSARRRTDLYAAGLRDILRQVILSAGCR